MKPAFVLTGGDARGAQQVGALKADADLHAKQAHNRYPIISGNSVVAVAVAAEEITYDTTYDEHLCGNSQHYACVTNPQALFPTPPFPVGHCFCEINDICCGD